MLIDDLETLPDRFKEGYRQIMLMHRNKDGAHGNAQRKCLKKTSQNKEDWLEIVREFKELKDTHYPNHRIYSSVNARDPLKAVREFKRRQLDHDYESTEKMMEFYADIQNRFFSCMMSPQCRAETLFLIDCDTPEEYQKAKERLHPPLILFEYPTKNGMHIITHPFNPEAVKVDVKKDDLMLIG